MMIRVLIPKHFRLLSTSCAEFFFSHDLWEDWIKTTRNTAIDRENGVPRGPQLYAIIAYLSQSVNICYFYVPIAHQRIWNCVWIRSRGGAERMIRVLCNACDTHIVWSLPTAQHRILLVLRTAAISELEQLYHYMYLLLCIVSPCKLTEWMSKYILCAVLCMLRHSAACAALYLYCIFLFCLPIVDLLLLLTVRADIRMCAP